MTKPITMFGIGLLSAALALALLPPSTSAQEMDHSKMQMPAQKPAPAKKSPPPKAANKPAAKKPAAAKAPAPSAPAMDHSGMQMPMPAAKAVPAKPTVRKKAPAKPVKPAAAGAARSPKPASVIDHSTMPMPAGKDAMQGMDHSKMDMPADAKPMEGMDHSTMDMPKPAKQDAMQGMDHSKMDMPADAKPMEGMDHSTMGDMGAMPGMTAAPSEPITPIPAVTDADRAAAVPPAGGHSVHDNSIQNFTLINRLEGWDADPGTGLAWEVQSWIGTDLNRLWLRSEGERTGGRTESADLEVLYGRSVATWWDVVAGIRHDFKPGASQDFAAFGVIGLAPYKFEVEATAYIGQSGQTAARLEAEYETLITNRLILQPLIEVNLYGKDDPRRGIGSGLSTVEAGFRLRYEIIREFAPYIGIVRERAFGGTADLRRAEGEDINDTRLVAGFRIWF